METRQVQTRLTGYENQKKAGAVICLVAITTDVPALVGELQMCPPCKPEQS